MAAIFKPYLPTGSTFSGQMVYPATAIEVPDTVKLYMENVEVEYGKQFEIANTGYESKKYRIANGGELTFNIMFCGNSPKWVVDLLCTLANSVYGAGMPIQFTDDWITGSSGTPVLYKCRWVNAGDFVESSEILAGANMQLIAYDLPQDVSVEEYQKEINTPLSGLEWNLSIDTTGTDEQYYRVI